jgi:hypothetical protein
MCRPGFLSRDRDQCCRRGQAAITSWFADSLPRWAGPIAIARNGYLIATHDLAESAKAQNNNSGAAAQSLIARTYRQPRASSGPLADSRLHAT